MMSLYRSTSVTLPSMERQLTTKLSSGSMGMQTFTTPKSAVVTLTCRWENSMSIYTLPVINTLTTVLNRYQFGKYINNIGPQSKFPGPQGILNYYGQKWLAVEIWSRQVAGARLTNFSLVADTSVLTSYPAPALVPMPSYTPRPEAY
jgi:hypothetical protein